MDKKPRKIRKRKPLTVELRYHQLPYDATAQQALDRAFDVLFDATLRQIRSEQKESTKEAIDRL